MGGSMHIRFTVLAIALFSFGVFAGQVAVDVKLSPAGSFVAQTGKVTGTAVKNGDSVSAENVIVEVNSLSTGIELRDKHLKERLLAAQYPQIRLVKAVGKGGKGKARIEIMGKTKDVAGTYEIKGDDLKAQFKMKLSELDIKGVRYMGVGVKDEVVVKVDLPLKAK